MNGTLCKTSQGTDSIPGARATARGGSDSLFHKTTDTPAPQDLFATTPMKAMWREFNWQCEEEAYTSFEAAISNRVLALKERHKSAYLRKDPNGSVASALHTSASVAITIWYKVCSRRVGRRGLLLAGMALMLMLVGFDLMGLLVLYAR